MKIRTILLALMALPLAGCLSLTGVDPDRLDTANKQIADKVVFVKSVATFARRLLEGGVIDADQARSVGRNLNAQLTLLENTQRSIAMNGDPSEAVGVVEQVDRALATVLDLLTIYAPTQTRANFGASHAYQ